MISPIHRRPITLAEEERPSRGEFLRRLSRLGANLGVRYYRANQDRTGIDEVQAVALSCPQDAWVGAFGEPERITEYCETVTARSLRACQCWEHQCVDGMAKCIGRLFERLPDGSRLILLRVSFSGCGHGVTNTSEGTGPSESNRAHG